MRPVFKKPYIRGIQVVTPKEKLDLCSLSEIYGEKSVRKICKVTGIKEVCVAPKNMTSSDYCVEAAKTLLDNEKIDPQDIDAIVFVTETPDVIVPHTSAIMQDRLGLKKTTMAFDLNYGCAGFVYGLFQSFMLVETGYCKNVLLCCGDTLSKLINEKDKALRMVLGDAGSATIISARENADGKSAFNFYTDGSGAPQLIVPAGGFRTRIEHGITDVVVADPDGNARSQEDFYMNGMEIMNFALQEVPNVLDTLLKDMNLTLGDIDMFGFHQANELIVKYVAKKLKISMDKVPVSIEHTGNTSSVSIPTMLSNVLSLKEKCQKLNQVVLCAFGTGLACATTIVDLSNTAFYPVKSI